VPHFGHFPFQAHRFLPTFVFLALTSRLALHFIQYNFTIYRLFYLRFHKPVRLFKTCYASRELDAVDCAYISAFFSSWTFQWQLYNPQYLPYLPWPCSLISGDSCTARFNHYFLEALEPLEPLRFGHFLK